jgi:hypothetical protein
MKLFGIDTTKSYTEQELKNLEVEAELRFNHFVSKAIFITAMLVIGMVIWHLAYQLVAAILN